MRHYTVCTLYISINTPTCKKYSGLDEEAHWFVSKTGFKSRCESLMYESQSDLGFVMYNDKDNERGSSIAELWDRNCFQRALVRGTCT